MINIGLLVTAVCCPDRLDSRAVKELGSDTRVLTSCLPCQTRYQMVELSVYIRVVVM